MEDLIWTNPENYNWIGHTEIWPIKDISWTQKREDLFTRYQNWSKSLAYQLFKNYRVQGMEVDDYLHFACIGLLESIDRFDPNFGTHFKVFAKSRIRGSILNNIVKFSEKAQSLHWQNKLLKERLTAIQNSVTTQTICPAKSLVDTVLDLALGFLIETENEADNQNISLTGMQFDSMEISALQNRIFESFTGLTDIQQHVMNAHYKNSQSFTGIAQKLDLSTGRVSQLHAEALKHLRKKLLW